MKHLLDQDTIFALSSAPGRAGIAVVRISGNRAGEALHALANIVPEPRRAKRAALRDPQTGELLDRGLVLWFPGPNSVTGENVAELHLHGGRAVVAGVLEALAAIPGLRPAEAGEFTRRAFEAGKMDLAETEALADLLEADTAAQRRQALRGLDHGIGRKAEAWREALIGALALAEAEIDFPDEGDVPAGLTDRAHAIAAGLAAEMRAALEQKGGERLREGAVVVIAGPPNVGKSSFLNRIARREVAIVSPYAGTTRDMLEVSVDLGGYPATFIDTAGLRKTDDPVEREALRRARERAAQADLVLWFEAPDAPGEPDVSGAAPVWRVRNKSDLGESLPSVMPGLVPGIQPDVRFMDCRDKPGNDTGRFFLLSAFTGDGVADLLTVLSDWLRQNFEPGESALITRSRHRAALGEALRHLEAARQQSAPELFAEELRLSGRALGRISGRVDVEDVLDAIFGSFCIGK